LWVSPGWSLFSGPGVESQLDDPQRKQIFENVVSISTLLRRARITLYAVDPLGASDSLSRDFIGNPSPKVSTASGKPIGATSLAGSGVPERLNRSNDIAGELHQCLADAQAYYEIPLSPPATRRVNLTNATKCVQTNPASPLVRCRATTPNKPHPNRETPKSSFRYIIPFNLCALGALPP